MSDPAFQIWGIRAGDFEDSRQRWKERVKSLESFTKLRGRKEIALTYSPSASCIFYESARTHTGEKHGEGMEFPSSRFRELNGRSLQIEPGDESFEFRPLSPFFSLSLTLDTMKLRISLGGRASRPKQWSSTLDSETPFTPELRVFHETVTSRNQTVFSAEKPTDFRG